MAHAFNPSTWEAEAGRSLSSRIAWSRECIQNSQRYANKPCLKKTRIKIKESLKNLKQHKDGKYAENLDTVCYCVVYEFFDC